MIRIHRPAQSPAVLEQRGTACTADLCERYDRGERKFEYLDSVYAHLQVQEALARMQHGKCCYCETKVKGQVEHFRPKGETETQPGYYWLAFEWSNLFLACADCNSQKGTQFPLADSARRAGSHHDRCEHESPPLLNPAEDDPADFIGWRDEVPYALDGNERARVTIGVLKLDSAGWNHRRRDYLIRERKALALILRMAADLDDPSYWARVEAHFAQLCVASAPYSAMMNHASRRLRTAD